MTALEKNFLFILDADPFDPLALLAVADRLEEEGEPDMAAAYRRIHEDGLRPQMDTRTEHGRPYWWRRTHVDYAHPWCVREKVFRLLYLWWEGDKSTYLSWTHFPTRSAAFHALAEAICRAS